MNRYRTKRWVFLTMIVFIFPIPILFLFVKSFSYGWRWPEIFPDQWNGRGWRVIFQDPLLIQSINTTVMIAVIVVLLNLIIAIPAARAISFYNFKGKSVIETLMLIPVFIPVLAVSMGIHMTMIRLGLADHVVGVIFIHLYPTLPYSVRILRAGFDKVGKGWEEQAQTIGSNSVQTFWNITMPLILPSIRSAALLTFVISISQYVLTAIIGGGRVTTLSILYYPYFMSANEAVLASFSVLFALLPFTFFIITEGLFKLYMFLLRKS